MKWGIIFIFLVECVLHSTKISGKKSSRPQEMQKDSCVLLFEYIQNNWKYDSIINKYVIIDSTKVKYVSQQEIKARRVGFNLFEKKIGTSKCWVGMKKELLIKTFGKPTNENELYYFYEYIYKNCNFEAENHQRIQIYKYPEEISMVNYKKIGDGTQKRITFK